MKIFNKNNSVVKKHYSSIRNDKIDSIINDLSKKYDKDFCINIGAGKEANIKYTTVDIDKKSMPDIYGDIRTLFIKSPEYENLLSQYPDLSNIKSDYYVYCRMCHIMEHIEWIYIPSLLNWVYSILTPGGVLSIDTPNLEYIAKAYIKYLEIEDRGVNPKFPANEHNDLAIEHLGDMQRWINFKLYSGCSTGDYHNSCMDKTLITRFLYDAGFEKIYISSGTTLRVLAYKGDKSDLDTDSLEYQLSKITGRLK